MQKEKREMRNQEKKEIKFFPLFFISKGFDTFLPTTKEAAVIYVVPKVVNNETISKIPSQLSELASDWLNELKPENMKTSIKNTIKEVGENVSVE